MEAVGTKCGDVMRTHKCERCLSLFRTWDELRVHKRSHPAAKRRHECDTCGMEFSKKEYLRRHLMKKHDVVLEKGRCGRKSKYKCSDDDPRPYKCTECIREFAKYKPFNRHRQTHQKRFCDVCQEYVQTYAEHMKKVHGHEVPRNFHCDICNRAYRTKSDIVMHMKMHILMIENRTIPCKLCERTFYFNHDLRRHMKTHSLLRTIICDICGESFKTSETLKTHMRRHTGEKPFVCAFCPRSFSTSGSLNIHTRTHTDERPHQCDICHKAFRDASTMNVHKRQHTGDSPYCCHLCGRRTKQASNLRSHYRHFHKNSEITGRQIRLNSRVFARYTQMEIDEQLRSAGDLVALLSSGLEEYQAEQVARQKADEQLRERLGLSEIQSYAVDIKPTLTLPVKPEPSSSSSFIPASSINLAPADSNKSRDTFTASDINSVLSQFEISRTCSTEAPHELSANVKTEKLQIELASSTRSILEELDRKPPLPILTADGHHIESVFVDDDFASEPNVAAMLQIKIETADFGDNEFPSNGNELAWRAIPAVETKEELPIDIDVTSDFSWVDDGEVSADGVPSGSDYDDSVHNEQLTEKTPENASNMPMIKEEHEKKLKYIPKRSKCHACGKQYKNRDDHLQRHHRDIERPYECFICHRNYKKLNNVRQHLLTHSSVRNVICHICGNAYFNNSDLKKHILSAHTTERPHRCEQCGKSFKTQYGVTVHVRVHSGLKPYKCEVCFESFAALTSLKTHQRRHTGEKPFVCKFCGKAFTDSSTHRQHERVHSGEKPYKCHLCDRRTVQAGNLKSHYRHYHKIIVKNVSMYVEP